MKFSVRYVPKSLTRKEKSKQVNEILKSKKMYKQNKYYTRKHISSFHNKPSSYVSRAKSMYKVKEIGANKALAKATKCSVHALNQIIKKGEGAYYSSGSRPNQTAQSWGKARLASAVTGGKASAVDFTILQSGCKSNSKALRLAKTARKKYKNGTKRVPKLNIL